MRRHNFKTYPAGILNLLGVVCLNLLYLVSVLLIIFSNVNIDIQNIPLNIKQAKNPRRVCFEVAPLQLMSYSGASMSLTLHSIIYKSGICEDKRRVIQIQRIKA